MRTRVEKSPLLYLLLAYSLAQVDRKKKTVLHDKGRLSRTMPEFVCFDVQTTLRRHSRVWPGCVRAPKENVFCSLPLSERLVSLLRHLICLAASARYGEASEKKEATYIRKDPRSSTERGSSVMQSQSYFMEYERTQFLHIRPPALIRAPDFKAKRGPASVAHLRFKAHIPRSRSLPLNTPSLLATQWLQRRAIFSPTGEKIAPQPPSPASSKNTSEDDGGGGPTYNPAVSESKPFGAGRCRGNATCC